MLRACERGAGPKKKTFKQLVWGPSTADSSEAARTGEVLCGMGWRQKDLGRTSGGLESGSVEKAPVHVVHLLSSLCGCME